MSDQSHDESSAAPPSAAPAAPRAVDPILQKKSKKSKGGKAAAAGIFGDRLRIEIDQVKGRKLIAGTRFPVGSEVLSEKPVALITHSKKTLCSLCYQLIPIEQTSDDAGYDVCSPACSDACRADPARQHAVWNRLVDISGQRSCDAELLRLVVQLYFFLQKGQARGEEESAKELFRMVTDSCEESYLLGSAQTVLTLECHLETQSAGWKEAVSSATRDIAGILLQDNNESESALSARLLSLAAAINVNSYGVPVSGSSLGCCLLPCIGLLVNHSCDPNVTYTFENGRMKYKALKEISIGEEISVTYINPLVCTTERRSTLLSTKHFMCHCDRCDSYDTAVDHVVRGQAMDTLGFLDFDLDDHLSLASSGANSKKKKSGAGGGGNSSKPPPAAHLSIQPPKVSSALAMADAFLDGLFCDKCGSSGVILTAASGQAGCLLCAEKSDCASAEQAKASMTARGRMVIDAARRTGGVTADKRVSLQNWLNETDPSFGQIIEELKEKPATKPEKKKRVKTFQLHPCHQLVLEALKTLTLLLLGQDGGDVRGAIACGKRAIRITSALTPQTSSEMYTLLLTIIEALRRNQSDPLALREADLLSRSLLLTRTL